MTSDDLHAMAGSEDWEVRARAADRIGRARDEADDPVVLRLLGDASDTAVSEAMAQSLLEHRRENGVLPILRVLGSPIAELQEDTAFHLSMVLLQAWGDGVDVGGVLHETLARSAGAPELVAALEFVAWAAPVQLPGAETLSLIRTLTQHPDPLVAEAASDAVRAFDVS